eukprot:TRINITY_DN2498_c0_g1_i1.p1 TRINITY_DN2498_c0_g1~~TRINITY_DN2498_c0_g1_i1.p1  ORF type:complete len:224 (+),score=14.62 TRINITY_DN2498_c0_g1_i1:90-761(+)
MMRICVVCGATGLEETGKSRRSGFKCRGCVGKSSSQALREIAGSSEKYREMFQTLGYGYKQPVEWVVDGKLVKGVVRGSDSGMWQTGESLTVSIIDDHDGERKVTVPTSSLAPTIGHSMQFTDSRRGSYKISLTAADGHILYKVLVKGNSQTEYKVTKVQYMSESGSLIFPELDPTSKIWLPPSGPTWKSLAPTLWHLNQIASASRITHNIPAELHRGAASTS